VVAIAAGPVGQSGAHGRGAGWWAWGANQDGQTTVPSGLSNVVGIAAGHGHSLALSGLPPGVAVPAWVGSRFLVGTTDRLFYRRIIAKKRRRCMQFHWLASWFGAESGHRPDHWCTGSSRNYSVVLTATNSFGASASTVTLFLTSLQPRRSPRLACWCAAWARRSVTPWSPTMLRNGTGQAGCRQACS